MIRPGEIGKLTIQEASSAGATLMNGNDEVHLPAIDIPPKVKAGDEVEVFLFYNQEGEIEATTNLPDITVNKAGLVRVKSAGSLGAFVSIGSKRDIIVPDKEQRKPLEEGELAVIILKRDDRNGRLYATTRFMHHLENDHAKYKRGDQVNVIVAERIFNARKVIIENEHHGIIFDQDVLFPIRVGDRCKAYVRKNDRDGITLGFEKEGKELIDDAKEKIMNALNQSKGYLRLTDDSDAEEIKLRLRMSKKAFKRAIGNLYKEGKILITKRGIKLNKEQSS